MKPEWRTRLIATALYTLVAMIITWVTRASLCYLDAWPKFASIAAIPLFCLLGYYLWEWSHPDAGIRWQQGLAISYIVIISLTIVCLTFTALCISVDAALMPTDNVRKYDIIVGQLQSPLTAHFPRPLPIRVQTVRFYYYPGAMQAASILELGYTTTPERIDALSREYVRRSTLTFTAGTKDGYLEPVDCVAEEGPEHLQFTEDYTLFYLDKHPPTREKDWNHPYCHGVAISKKRCRVVYWEWGG